MLGAQLGKAAVGDAGELGRLVRTCHGIAVSKMDKGAIRQIAAIFFFQPIAPQLGSDLTCLSGHFLTQAPPSFVAFDKNRGAYAFFRYVCRLQFGSRSGSVVCDTLSIQKFPSDITFDRKIHILGNGTRTF
jgi:hypothetical protein